MLTSEKGMNEKPLKMELYLLPLPASLSPCCSAGQSAPLSNMMEQLQNSKASTFIRIIFVCLLPDSTVIRFR